MRKRRQVDDNTATEGGPDSGAAPAEVASSFEAAQALLQTALEDLRRAEANLRATRPEGFDDATAAGSPAPRQRRRRPRPEPTTSPAASPTASPTASSPPASSEPSATAPPAASVDDDLPTWSARTVIPSSPGASAPPVDEFEGLTDTMYAKPNRTSRRWRRPPAAAAAGAAVVETSASETAAVAGPTDEARVEHAEWETRDADWEPDADLELADADAQELHAEIETLDPDVETLDPDVETLDPDVEIPETDVEIPETEEDQPVVLAPVSVAAAHSYADDEPRRGLRQHTRTLVAAGIAVVVGIGALALVFSGGGKSDEPALRAGGQALLRFDPVTTAEGATVTRVWTLRGAKGGQFEGRLAFANPTAAPLRTSFTEVIPKSLASSVTDIEFDPQPVVIKADPVVQYSLTIPAGGDFTATYKVRVAPDGARQARLDSWAKDLPPQETTTTTTTTAPATTTTPTTPRPATTNAPPAAGNNPAPNPGPTPPSPTGPPTTEPPPPPAATGTIVIRVVSRNGTGTFTLSGPGGSVSLTTDGSPNGVAETAMTVDAGTHPWTQDASPGWVLSNIDCTDRDSGPFENRSTVSGSTVTFNVQPNEIVVCTFTNNKA